MMYVRIEGRLGADSELKTSKSGNKFVTMRVASNDYVNGENVTTWVRVMWSGERAIKMQEHMKKGSFVGIWGTPRVSLYDNKNGEKAISIDVMADRVDFIGNGNSGTTQASDAVTDTGTLNRKTEDKVAESPTPQTNNADVDDLPF